MFRLASIRAHLPINREQSENHMIRTGKITFTLKDVFSCFYVNIHLKVFFIFFLQGIIWVIPVMVSRSSFLSDFYLISTFRTTQ